jgi:O-antigen ligase
MLEAGMTMVAERPLFGLGPEMVERRYPIYRPPSAPRFDVPHLHNSFLQLAAERGLPALLAYLAMSAASLWALHRCYRREGGSRGPRADLCLGAMLALLAFHVAGLFENNWGDTEVQRPVLFLLALPFCLAAGEAEGGGKVDMLPGRPEADLERT